MNMKNNIFLTLAIATAIFSGCAKDVTPSANQLTKEYLDLWLKKNHPHAKIAGNGIYILEDKEGTGETFKFESYAMVNTTASSLDGTISSSTYENIAKQLGTYNPAHYYGARTWQINESNVPVGLYDMMKGMKKGGTRKALVPSWLMGYKRYGKSSDYINNTAKDASTSIYEITLEDFTNDLKKYQIKAIEKVIAKKYPGLDSTKTGFYYKQLKAPKGKTPFKKDTTIYINYTGRLLNGLVFDTTIADTAKAYNIYSSAKKYKPVGISWKKKHTDIKFSSEKGSLITGFQLMLSKMGAYEKAEGLFISDYGYASKSVGKAIPPFSPLIFEIELVAKPKE